MNCLDSILSPEIPCSRSRPAHIIPCITMVAVVFKAAGPHTHAQTHEMQMSIKQP